MKASSQLSWQSQIYSLDETVHHKIRFRSRIISCLHTKLKPTAGVFHQLPLPTDEAEAIPMGFQPVPAMMRFFPLTRGKLWQ